MTTDTTTSIAAGWYTDPAQNHLERWWDGTQWTQNVRVRQTAPIQVPPPVPARHASHGPLTHGELTVDRRVVYTRQQKDHSVVLHIMLAFLTAGLSLPWTIYYAVSPNHFFHT